MDFLAAGSPHVIIKPFKQLSFHFIHPIPSFTMVTCESFQAALAIVSFIVVACLIRISGFSQALQIEEKALVKLESIKCMPSAAAA